MNQEDNNYFKLSFSFQDFFKYFGGSFIIIIAYIDPGNLEADLQVGSYSKYQLIWILLLSIIIGFIFQYLSILIGLTTRKHLAEMCKIVYTPNLSLILWILAEISIIACDIQGVIATAIALEILFGIPLWIGCLVTCFDIFTFLLIDFAGMTSHQIEWFFVSLTTMMTICFFWNFSVNPPSFKNLISGTFIPTISDQNDIRLGIGLVGSIILPQNYFLHSAVVLKKNVNLLSSEEIYIASKYMSIDTGLALIIAFVINLMVVSCFAELFYNKECLSLTTKSACLHLDLIDSSSNNDNNDNILCYDPDGEEGRCSHIGLSDAGSALTGALGNTASIIWAIGLLASAQSSTMTVTYAGKYLTEGFTQKKTLLSHRIIFCRCLSLLLSILSALLYTYFYSSVPLMDEVTQWGNFVASLCAPFSFLPMIHIYTLQHLIPQNLQLSYLFTCFLWILSILLIFSNIYLIWNYTLSISCYDEESIIQLKDIKINEKFINPGIISTISTSSSTTTTISSNTSDKVENRE